MIPALRTVTGLRAAVYELRASGERIGLVPTMGALHAGHLALVSAALAAGERPIVTIFVNPTQFSPSEDFAAYPRNEQADIAAAAAAGAVAVFAPPATEVYPDGFATSVRVGGLSEGLCGPFRPGHFAGMATVVTKLLLMALPDSAYFGEKDYQQLQIVRRLARDLDIPVRIVGIPTVREADGLALSSRNVYLTAIERSRAGQLRATLAEVAGAVRGGTAVDAAIDAGQRRLAVAGFYPIDYVSVCDAESLIPIIRLVRPARVLGAAHLGRTRLIDNVPLLPH